VRVSHADKYDGCDAQRNWLHDAVPQAEQAGGSKSKPTSNTEYLQIKMEQVLIS
jgi:hypothetical protein